MSDPEIQEDTYSQFRDYLEYPPYVRAVLAEIAEKQPAARNIKPDDMVEICFVAELDQKGGAK